MNIKIGLLLINLSVFSFVAPSQSQEIIDKSIVAHGMYQLINSEISFTFRNIYYSVSRKEDTYKYQRSFIKDSILTQDYLVNSKEFFRVIALDTISIVDEWKQRYSNSINSVFYFFQIPYVLNDQAVNKKHLGTDRIGGQTYQVIKVTFGEENGGQDHDDIFLYWINTESYFVDYLAYSYKTGKGGVRFRKAINRRKIEEITFQDYVNYEAKKGTPLEDLPELYTLKKLTELSRIVNENIIVKKMN